ncbi:MAG: KH domain-containing protein [Proteobacteria bacterium]|nr:KH domain-containing protein [Pseudomonadota bacterium]
MKELVKCIAISLVDQVSRIQIAEIQGNQTHIIELKVAKEDIGKVIGRQGRTADAIRTILNCAAAKLSKRYILQIIDEGRNHRNHKPHDRV